MGETIGRVLGADVQTDKATIAIISSFNKRIMATIIRKLVNKLLLTYALMYFHKGSSRTSK